MLEYFFIYPLLSSLLFTFMLTDRKLMRKLLFICGAGILSTVKIKVLVLSK